MRNLIRLIIVFSLITLGVVAGRIFFKKDGSSTQKNSLIIEDEIRQMARLIVFEQDFTIAKVNESKSMWMGIPFEENIITIADGRMGFAIDLNDPKTKITNEETHVLVESPLKLAYCDIDWSTMKQVVDQSMIIHLNKDTIKMNMKRYALEEYGEKLYMSALKYGATYAEHSLSKIADKPVYIEFTQRLPDEKLTLPGQNR